MYLFNQNQTQMKTHHKLLANPDFIGTYLLENEDGTFREMNVTIQNVTQSKVFNPAGKSEQVVVANISGQKPMILNATNRKRLGAHFGNFIEDWAGKTVTIYVEKVKAKGGEWTHGLRVKETLPTAAPKPELTPEHPKWGSAVTAMAAGNTTIEAIRKSYTLSVENEKILTAKP